METEYTSEKDLFPYPFSSPRDILTAFFRQKLTISIIFFLMLIGMGSWIYSQDTLYASHATIVLKFGREHIFRPEVGQVDQIVQFNQQAAVESERKILESRDLVRRVVDAIGIGKLYPEIVGPTGDVEPWMIESATSRFLGHLESTAPDDTNLIEIIFLHQRPEVAALALTQLVELLKERHLQIFSDPKASFLIGRLKEYENGLNDAEKSLQVFKQKYDISSPLGDQQARLLDQRAVLDSNNKTIEHELQGLASKVTSLESQMKVIPKNVRLSTSEGTGMLSKAKSDLFALKRREQELLTRYTATSSPVQNLQKEIALVEQFIISQTNNEEDKSGTSGKNPIFQKLEIERLSALSDLKTRRASQEVILSQIKELDEKLMRLDKLSEELVGLERERVTAEGNYQLYVKKVEEAKVSEEMDQLKMSNIGVIQAADIPSRPAGRSKGFKLFLGSIFAGFVSMGLAFVFEYFQGGYTRPDQAAEDLGLPVLASFNQKVV